MYCTWLIVYLWNIINIWKYKVHYYRMDYITNVCIWAGLYDNKAHPVLKEWYIWKYSRLCPHIKLYVQAGKKVTPGFILDLLLIHNPNERCSNSWPVYERTVANDQCDRSWIMWYSILNNISMNKNHHDIVIFDDNYSWY